MLYTLPILCRQNTLMLLSPVVLQIMPACNTQVRFSIIRVTEKSIEMEKTIIGPGTKIFGKIGLSGSIFSKNDPTLKILV